MSKILKVILSTILLFSIVIYANINKKSTSDIRKIRGKIITDDSVTVATTQKVYKLTFLGIPYDKKQITNLFIDINKEVPINIQSALKRYFRDRNNKYKVVLYGLSKNDIVKIQNLLDSIGSKGFSFVLSGERRVYPYGNFLTPVLGYNKKQINTTTNFTYLEGVSGVEKEYNTLLIRAKDVYLSIDFQRQRSLEKELLELKALYNAREVISLVLDDTFHIKAFASSNRYIPNDIHRKDFSNLDVHSIHYIFKLNEFSTLVGDALYLNAKNPKYQIYADLELNQRTGIDLANERVYDNGNSIEFSNYKVNFMQLVKAYSPFYLGGYIGNPKLVKTQDTEKKQIISRELAQSLKKKADIFFGIMPGKRVSLEFDDRNISASIYMKGFTQNNHHYLQAYFIIYNQKEMPFDIVVKSEVSSSNQYLEAIIYSKKDNHKIGKVVQPINKYQTNKRHGSEIEIVGIYKASDSNYYIDSITTKRTKTASCNACQTYNIETFQVTEEKLISKGLRSFDIDSYIPYNDEK